MRVQASAKENVIYLAIKQLSDFVYIAMGILDKIFINYFVRTNGSVDFNWFAILSVATELIKPAVLRIHFQIVVCKNALVRVGRVRAWQFRHIIRLCRN